MNDLFLTRPLPQSQQWAETQLEIIKREVTAYQQKLDQDHDVVLSLTHFGHSVLMEVEQISVESPVILAFRGRVDGRPSVLLQHVNQLSFLLTSLPTAPNQPHRKIGFASHWEE